MPKKKKRPRTLVLAGLALVIISEIVILSPSTLEENKPGAVGLDPDTLVQDHDPTLIPDLPKDRVAEYSVEKYHYVSVQNGEKQWKIEAQRAFLYNPERMVHSRNVKAFLYDPDGKATIVTGQEARYYLNQKDLEMYGNVRTLFPDGFETQSEYLRYNPKERHIQIPTQFRVLGFGEQNSGQIFKFDSMGLDYLMNQAYISLLEEVTVILEKPPVQNKKDNSPGVPEITTIQSDHCFINRNIQLAKFTMNPARSLDKRFVHITQPTLFTRSRRANLNYGDFTKVLQYLTAFDDVLIKEIPDPADEKSRSNTGAAFLRYATSGRADFDTHRDVIVLTKLPQVYQDQDTVIGETILLHRDTDVVEVEQSNAYSQGSE